MSVLAGTIEELRDCTVPQQALLSSLGAFGWPGRWLTPSSAGAGTQAANRDARSTASHPQAATESYREPACLRHTHMKSRHMNTRHSRQITHQLFHRQLPLHLDDACLHDSELGRCRLLACKHAYTQQKGAASETYRSPAP